MREGCVLLCKGIDFPVLGMVVEVEKEKPKSRETEDMVGLRIR